MAMNIPQIASVEVSVTMYCEKPWPFNADIQRFFRKLVPPPCRN